MVKKLFRWFIVSAVLVVSLSGFTVYGAPLSSGGSGERTQVKDSVKVVCENGVMLGKSEEGVVSFKGIPFAKPPVGKLRWKAPQAPDQAATKSNVTTSDTQRCSMNGLPNQHPILLKAKIV